jgi:hypothetical protein
MEDVEKPIDDAPIESNDKTDEAEKQVEEEEEQIVSHVLSTNI